MAKPKTKDEVAEAVKNGRLSRDKAVLALFDLNEEPRAGEINEWLEEAKQRKAVGRETNQLPVVLLLVLVVALLFGAIAWIISYVIFDKGDTTSLLLASQIGQFTFTVGIVIAIVLAAERRASA